MYSVRFQSLELLYIKQVKNYALDLLCILKFHLKEQILNILICFIY